MSLFSNIKKMFGADVPEEKDCGCPDNCACGDADVHSDKDCCLNDKCPEDNAGEQTDKDICQEKKSDEHEECRQHVTDDDDPMDLDKMNMCQFITFNNEMTRDIPEDRQIRLVNDTKITIREFLDKSGIDTSDIKADWFYVVNVDWAGKELHEGGDLDSYCIFDDLLERNEKGESRNTFVYISYADGRGFIELNIMMDGHLGDDMLLLNRASVAHKKPSEDAAVCSKILFTFSLEPLDEMVHRAEGYKVSGIKKLKNHEEPDLFEITALGFDSNYVSHFNDGTTLMRENRWGDAISSLTNAYDELKEIILTERDDEALEYFRNTCHSLGKCYYRKHLYHKASFYLERACSIKEEKEAVDMLNDCIVRMNDLRIMKSEQESFPKDTFVMEQVFESLFDIIPGELADMMWIDNVNRSHGSVKKQSDILRFDIRRAMENTDSMTLHLSYRYHTTVIDDEFIDDESVAMSKSKAPNNDFYNETTKACVDKSIRMTDNMVVVNLSKKDKVITMNVMVPQFRFSDNNNHGFPKCIMLQYADSEYISREGFEKLRNGAAVKNGNNEQMTYEEAHSLASVEEAAFYFANGSAAFNKKMFGDALFYLAKACNLVLVKRASDDITDADRSVVFESFFMMGFIFSDLKHFEMSIYYLAILHHFNNLNWNCEFINSLANSKDIYAYGVVAGELERLKEPEKTGLKPDVYNSYYLFLLRRMAHIMIDKEMFDDAEKLINDIKEQPGCKEWAEQELRFIKEHRD